MTGEIITLEGVSCAGKSSTLKKLSKDLGAATVPELPEFGRHLFRGFEDGESICFNGYKSIPIEKIRMLGATGLSELAPYVVLDRSFFSTIALGYGAIDLIGEEAFRGITRSVVDEVESDRMQVPDKVLHLHVDGETAHSRNQTRVPKLDDYWVDIERVERQNHFYATMNEVDGIATINANRTTDEVVDDCSEVVHGSSRLNANNTVEAIEDFLTDI